MIPAEATVSLPHGDARPIDVLWVHRARRVAVALDVEHRVLRLVVFHDPERRPIPHVRLPFGASLEEACALAASVAEREHARDADCVPFLVDRCCALCGVTRATYAGRCRICEGCSFHRDGCPEAG